MPVDLLSLAEPLAMPLLEGYERNVERKNCRIASTEVLVDG